MAVRRPTVRLVMRQSMRAGTAVGIAAPAWPHGGLDLSRKATVCIDIIAAYHYVASGSATRDGRTKIDLSPILHRSGGTGSQFRFMDRRRRRWRAWFRGCVRPFRHHTILLISDNTP